jgi:hypothetical protein
LPEDQQRNAKSKKVKTEKEENKVKCEKNQRGDKIMTKSASETIRSELTPNFALICFPLSSHTLNAVSLSFVCAPSFDSPNNEL